MVWRAAFWADFVLAIDFHIPARRATAAQKNKRAGF
jgi:hypothetical protein